MPISYKKISKDNEKDLNIPNEPIDIIGRLIVSRSENEWSHSSELFTEKTDMIFPNEAYDSVEINGKGFAIGAYDQDKCVGLAVMQDDWAKFMYLADLKINRAYRKRGIAAELMKECKIEADKRKYKGIYTVAQDNNLIACRFYMNQGFEIGGLNTHGYKYTTQEHKADIYFYLDN